MIAFIKAELEEGKYERWRNTEREQGKWLDNCILGSQRYIACISYRKHVYILFWTRFITAHIVYCKQTRSGEKWLCELFIKESHSMTIYDFEVCICHCRWGLPYFLPSSHIFDQSDAHGHVCGLCVFTMASRHLCLSPPDVCVFVRDMKMNIFIPRHNDFSLVTWHLP